MGPAGLLTKVDRLVTGLDFVRLTHTCSTDSQRNSEIQTAQKRMGAWKIGIRKEKKKDTVAHVYQEEEMEYKLEELTSVIRDERMLSDFESLTRRPRPLNYEEMKLATAMAAVVLLFSSTQRPGAVMNCTMGEYENRKEVDGVTVISVTSHKTSTGGPARLTLDRDAADMLEDYVSKIRPEIGGGPYLLLLPTEQGSTKVERMGPLYRLLERRYGVEVPPATKVRKAVSTLGARALEDGDVRLLARKMSHRLDTHRRHYQKTDTVAGAAKAHQIVKSLAGGSSSSTTTINPKIKQTRIQYSNKEVVEITAHFSRAIAAQQSISLGEAREFLQSKGKWMRRQPKQIQDKVSSVIKKNKEDGYGPTN